MQIFRTEASPLHGAV